MEQKPRFRGESSLQTWFFAVIRNTARELARKESVRQVALLRWAAREPELPAEADAQRTLEIDEEKMALRAEMRKLSYRQQQILHLVFYEAMTINESATVLQITIGSARTHYERAKQRLRETLQITPARSEDAIGRRQKV